MMMCSNLPGSLLQPTLALMLLLRAVRSQYADYCGGFGFLDQCQTRLSRRSAHPQLAIETALSVQSGTNAQGFTPSGQRQDPRRTDYRKLACYRSRAKSRLSSFASTFVVVSLNTYMFLAANSGLKISSSKFKTRCTPTFVQV